MTGPLEATNSAYAIAKIAGIKLCNALYNQYKLDIVALMPTNVYGVNDKYSEEMSHVIPAMILKFLKAKKHNKKTIELWGNGSPKREFIFLGGLACVYQVWQQQRSKWVFWPSSWPAVRAPCIGPCHRWAPTACGHPPAGWAGCC
jgi:GDP-L-fucose synthase